MLVQIFTQDLFEIFEIFSIKNMMINPCWTLVPSVTPRKHHMFEKLRHVTCEKIEFILILFEYFHNIYHDVETKLAVINWIESSPGGSKRRCCEERENWK